MIRRLLPAALLAAALLAGSAVPALAHNDYRAGPLLIEAFGLANEPVLAGEETAYEFSVLRGGRPVEWTEAQTKLLAVHVFPPEGVKIEPRSLQIHATPWEGPGSYRSDPIAFSAPGSYFAHLHSPLKGVAGATRTIPVGGVVIDVKAPMGEGSYGPVDDPKSIQWPAVSPTSAELAARQAADQARMDAAAADLREAQRVGRVSFGLLLAAGALSLLLAGLALRRSRRRPAVPDSPAGLWQGASRTGVG